MPLKTIRTSILLDVDLLKKVKLMAKRKQVTIKQIVQNALVEYVNKPAVGDVTDSFKFNPIVKEGVPVPGVDLDDRDNLYSHMDDIK